MVGNLGLFQGSKDDGGDVLVRVEIGVSDFFEENKENMCVFMEDVVEPLLQRRSPLPIGYPRSPLQDITATLSCMNPNADEDECGGHKKSQWCRTQQKPLVLPCAPFVEEVASSQTTPLGQCTVLECLESAGPSESMASVTQELTQHQSTSNEMAAQSRKTMLSRMTIENESEKQVQFDKLIAESLHQAKEEHLVVMASSLSCAEQPVASPSSQTTKRRKPFVKLIPGQSVPRFRYPLKTALCSTSQPEVVWVVNSSEQDVCA